MQRQTIKIRSGRHVTENEGGIVDWPLTAGIAGAVLLVILLIWGIATALGI